MRNRKLALGLLATAAMMVMAFGASSASATTVTPAGAQVTATNQPETTTNLLAGNGYLNEIRCKKSKAVLSTPTSAFNPGALQFNNNRNQTGVGTQSTGPGSVEAQFQEKPVFEECSVWNEQKEIPGVEVTVTTTDKWTASAESSPSGDALLAVGVPQAGATIDLGAPFNCKITVSPDQQGVVFARYDNEGKLTVDGQISARGCGVEAPNKIVDQFEGSYDVDSGFLIEP